MSAAVVASDALVWDMVVGSAPTARPNKATSQETGDMMGSRVGPGMPKEAPLSALPRGPSAGSAASSEPVEGNL